MATKSCRLQCKYSSKAEGFLNVNLHLPARMITANLRLVEETGRCFCGMSPVGTPLDGWVGILERLMSYPSTKIPPCLQVVSLSQYLCFFCLCFALGSYDSTVRLWDIRYNFGSQTLQETYQSSDHKAELQSKCSKKQKTPSKVYTLDRRI